MATEEAVRDFLRNPPQGLHIRQRIAFEAIGYALDAIALSYTRLRGNALRLVLAQSETGPEKFPRLPFFVDAWSMIDQAHALKCLLESFSEGELDCDVTDDFIEKYRDVSFLRNRMDHLAESIKNISESKKSRPTILGSISFILCEQIENEEVKKSAVYLLTGGSFIKEKHAMEVQTPAGLKVEVPVGGFKFSAFDRVVQLSALFEDAIALRTFFNTEAASRISEQIREWAEKEAHDAEMALAPAAEGLVVVLKFQAKDLQDSLGGQ